jgi:hypothetical protein
MDSNNTGSSVSNPAGRHANSAQLEAMHQVMEQLLRLNNQLESARFGKVARVYPQLASNA